MYIDKNIKERSSIFCNNLLDTDRGFNYFVNWDNIKGYEEFDVEIHAIDTLIGVRNDNLFRQKFTELLKKLPTTIILFPYLFGLAKEDRTKLRKGNTSLKIIQKNIDESDSLIYSFKKQSKQLTDEEIEKYYKFFERMGLKTLYQTLIEKSTWDYINGVLVGLDSNGRKNRGGKAFELACLPLFEELSNKYKLHLLYQKKLKALRAYNISVPENYENRIADFILLSPDKTRAINFEVNFFNGGGSKPDAIIGDYITRQNVLSQFRIAFSLITDGNCWKNNSDVITNGFKNISYLQNFYMLKHGMLEEIIRTEFNL